MYDLNVAFADGCLEGLDGDCASDGCPFDKHHPLHRAAWLIGLDHGRRSLLSSQGLRGSGETDLLKSPDVGTQASASARRLFAEKLSR